MVGAPEIIPEAALRVSPDSVSPFVPLAWRPGGREPTIRQDLASSPEMLKAIEKAWPAVADSLGEGVTVNWVFGGRTIPS